MTADDRVRRQLPWLVAVALFMENLDATIVNTAAPTMAASLGVEPLSLKGVLTSYTLALAVFIPVSGWAADRFGTKRRLRVGGAVVHRWIAAVRHRRERADARRVAPRSRAWAAR